MTRINSMYERKIRQQAKSCKNTLYATYNYVRGYTLMIQRLKDLAQGIDVRPFSPI